MNIFTEHPTQVSETYLQHDNYSECCTVEQTDKGIRLKETFTLSEIL